MNKTQHGLQQGRCQNRRRQASYQPIALDLAFQCETQAYNCEKKKYQRRKWQAVLQVRQLLQAKYQQDNNSRGTINGFIACRTE
ncbi:hypothetical protein [Chromobacterium amazonense]|uniref:Uncharacterized protein n=1 Tax=Chromobacterium amazonense TaxID=1382803 RepID=A0ABU8V4H4_9NEIS|nr:hypothetical protein [Chromobacterium amazonense]MDQ4540157.1 hypothetical protein [Chromobacterium amazonense]